MGNNRTAAAPILRLHGDRFAAFDALPAALRHILQNAVVNWCDLQARRKLNRLIKAGYSEAEAVELLAAEYAAAERAEIVEFGYRWPSRFGRYPHLAAQATVLRGTPPGAAA